MTMDTMFNTKTLNVNLITAFPIRCEGTRFLENLVIPLEDIYVPPMADNFARKEGKDPKHVMALKYALADGIDYSKAPPVVRKNSRILNGKHYKYELIAGNHRYEALYENKYEEWIFSVYEFGLDGCSFNQSKWSFQLKENDHLPQLVSSPEDIANAIVRIISEKIEEVPHTKEQIKDMVKKYTKTKVTDIVNKIIAACGIYQDIVTYTQEDVKRFVSDNTDYVGSGHLDRKRKKIGWTVKEGYEQEYVMNGMRKYAETDKESYFLCHTKSPTEKMNLKAKRESMLDTFDSLSNALVKTFEFWQKNGRLPFSVEAFLPQDHKANEKGLIKIG